MPLTDRLLGLCRSMAIYHAIPGRQRRLRRLYSQFAHAGDLVFDVGAHAGNHTRALAALGCRVVAVEPQPDFSFVLRTLFRKSSTVSIVEAAVGEQAGRASLSVSDRTPTVTSLSTAWLGDRARDPGFSRVRWNRQLDIEMTTLDALIGRHGVPAFIKLDVEGGEPAVLAGLSRAVAALCFEYLPGALAHAEACVTRLLALGPYRFNWSLGESYELASPSWLDGDRLLATLHSTAAQQRSGDVYARLEV